MTAGDIILGANSTARPSAGWSRSPATVRCTRSRPQRQLAAARRLRRLPHRRRQQPGGGHRHPEEHRVRLRPRARRRLAGEVPDDPGQHFVDDFAWVTGGRWAAEQYSWARIVADGQPHDHAFVRTGQETRTAVVQMDQEQVWVLAGLKDCVVLKSTGSEFHGFPRDRYTTLTETDDRILATSITAWWRYTDTDLDFNATYAAVRDLLLETFASVHSQALQQTIFAAGRAILEAHPEIAEIKMSCPIKHHFPGRPRSVRPDQPQRGVLRRRSTLRRDPGHDPARRGHRRAAGLGQRP